MPGLFLVVLLTFVSIAPAQDAVLTDLVTTARHVALNPDDALDRYSALAEKYPAHELGRLARLVAAAHRLAQLGKREDPAPVVAWLDAQPAPAGPLKPTLDQLDKSVRAHVGMLRLVRALRDYHRRHVEFPESLDKLAEEKLIDAAALTDPFGQRYEYQPKARSAAPDMPRQDFTLRCVTLDVEHRRMPELYAQFNDSMKDLSLRSTAPAEGEAFAAERKKDGTMGAARQWKVGQEQYGCTLVAVLDGAAVITRNGLPRVVAVQDK